MNRILILGASGFIGYALYRELRLYFDVYGTFFTNTTHRQNKHFLQFDVETDEIDPLLQQIKPAYIISALRGNFEAQVETHARLATYAIREQCCVIYLSSANVFDGFSHYPSYEYDKTLSESIYGRFKIKIENLFLKIPEEKYVIARLPMVFGYASPRVKELRETIQSGKPYEVFPNLVVNTAYSDKLVQQFHYIINQQKRGIFHLGSKDLIHHDEFIREVVEKLHLKNPVLKNVYTSNFDRFLAVLPKDNQLPEHLAVYNQQVIENSTLP